MTDKTLRVLLPDGIGYVEIRTGNVHGATGYPVVAIEAVSYSEAEGKAAPDDRVYERRFRFDGSHLYLVGHPATEWEKR
jgi:hypothetical protein